VLLEQPAANDTAPSVKTINKTEKNFFIFISRFLFDKLINEFNLGSPGAAALGVGRSLRSHQGMPGQIPPHFLAQNPGAFAVNDPNPVMPGFVTFIEKFVNFRHGFFNGQTMQVDFITVVLSFEEFYSFCSRSFPELYMMRR